MESGCHRRKEIDPPQPYSYHWDCEDHQGGSRHDKEWVNTDGQADIAILYTEHEWRFLPSRPDT